MKLLKPLSLALLCLILLVSIVFAQPPRESSFAVEQVIGAIRPQGIIYNPRFDQFAFVNPLGQFLLADATNYQTQHILHENGSYNAYAFSHDGRWLALAIDRRVELWNTQSGVLAAQFEPDGALSVTGPLLFASDDVLLNFTAIVRAPAATRRSENDTSQIPWLWDLPAAREEGRSSLPRGVTAYTFFDFRNGFVLGPNDKALAALPQRLLILDIADPALPVVAEIPSQRFERDPISVWFSLRDEQMYVRPINQNNLFQVKTASGTTLEIPIGRELNHNLIALLDELELSQQARIIGEPNSQKTNSLLQLLLGADYRRSWNYHPLTVTLIDILKPITLTEEQSGFLVYILDEQTGRGMVDFVSLNDASQFALHPDNRHLVVRRISSPDRLEVYDMDSGLLANTYLLNYPASGSRHPLSYNETGSAVVAEFERFDAVTGETLYQNLNYDLTFNQFFFTADSQGLVTFDGFNWWLWDIPTGQVIRRETVNLVGEVLQITEDGHRFLTRTETSAGPRLEVVDVGKQERHSVVFEQIPGQDILQILPGPNWENFIVVYAPSIFRQTTLGSDIAIYNLYDGKRWFIAADDLIGTDGAVYDWLDNDTAYVYTEGVSSILAAERLYGLNFHASGLPLCLVDAFPETWIRWVDLWERLNEWLTPNELGQLTLRLCAALPGTEDDIEAVFHPSPTPTRIPATPRPAVIAGVPACLTQRFPSQALDYAQDWREITRGLSPDEVRELEDLLCEGLNASGGIGGSGSGTRPDALVMLIDAETGARSFGGYLPPHETAVQYNVQLVIDEFRRTERARLNTVVLSPDARFMAANTSGGQIIIYRLLTSYETLAARQEQVAAATQAEAPRSIAVLPTATQPFTALGQPRPTLTPTITPTSPPPPEQHSTLPARDEIVELCPSDHIYHINSAPPEYAASGRLFVTHEGSGLIWVLDPGTGHTYPDETIPRCDFDVFCSYAFDLNHMVIYGDTISVARPDGSDMRVLFTAEERAAWPDDVRWVDNDTLEYRFQGYIPDRSINPFTFIQRIELNSAELPEPVLQPAPISVNELPTQVLAFQPGGPLALVRTSFDTGTGIGYKYYLHNSETGHNDYFARLSGSVTDLLFEWQPLGEALYYRYPESDTWYVYDASTGEHRILGEYPGGYWSRDGRYKADWFALPPEEFDQRVKTGEPLPKLRIWDSKSGQMRRYCIPQTDSFATGEMLFWSPDSRYIAFRLFLSEFDLQGFASKTESSAAAPTPTFSPDGSIYEAARPATLVLDTITGTITELGIDVPGILLWTTEPTEDQP